MFQLLGQVLSLRGESPEKVRLEVKATEFSVLLACSVLSKADRYQRNGLFEELRIKLIEETYGESVPELEKMVFQFDPAFSIKELPTEGRRDYFHGVWLKIKEYSDYDEQSGFIMLDRLSESERVPALIIFSKETINHFRSLVDGLILHGPEGVTPQIESQKTNSTGKET